MLYKSIGKIEYSFDKRVGYRLVLNCDQGISDFYRKLIPKYYCVNGLRYRAHISIIRHEKPLNLANWNKHQGKEIEWYYDNQIKSGNLFFWLNAFSKDLEEIRLELGLNIASQFTVPPAGFKKTFHMSIGNMKL